MFSKIATLVSTIALGVCLLFPATARAATPTTGAMTSWFTTSDATKLSIDFTIHGSQQGYHYYSLSPFFEGKEYGLYSGIQTTKDGPLYIFSVWNAKAAYPENGAYKITFDNEGSGYSLRKKYDWKLGTPYTVTIQREGYDHANHGWRWSSTITNKATGTKLKLGEIPAPAGADLLRSGGVFHERYGGHTPTCGATTNLEKTAVIASNLSSDKPVSFTGQTYSNGVFSLPACKAYSHVTAGKNTTASALGMTQNEFSAVVHPQPKPTAPKPAPTPAPQVAADTDTHADHSGDQPTAPPAAAPAPQAQPATTTAEALPNTGISLLALPVILGILAGVVFYLQKKYRVIQKVRWIAHQVGLPGF